MVVNPSNADVVTFVSTVSDYNAIGVASWEDQAVVYLVWEIVFLVNTKYWMYLMNYLEQTMLLQQI